MDEAKTLVIAFETIKELEKMKYSGIIIHTFLERG